MKNLEKLKEIAKSAGEIVKRGFESNKEIQHKGVVDLVTQYDVECEEYIISELKKEFPNYTLVGEESYTGDYNLEKAIYIDPIDGTTNFIHGIPHLAISLGLWEFGKPLMGVVYNPILNEMFFAKDGEGAYLNGNRISVSNSTKLQNALIATGFPYAKVNRGKEYKWVVENFSNLLPYIQDFRRLGSAALDLSYLAQGKFDGFYEIDLKPWDVSAAILLVQEAGGKIYNLNGEDYSFEDRVIIAGNSKIAKILAEKLTPFK